MTTITAQETANAARPDESYREFRSGLAIYYGGPESLSRVAVELYSEGGKRRGADPLRVYWRSEP